MYISIALKLSENICLWEMRLFHFSHVKLVRRLIIYKNCNSQSFQWLWSWWECKYIQSTTSVGLFVCYNIFFFFHSFVNSQTCKNPKLDIPFPYDVIKTFMYKQPRTHLIPYIYDYNLPTQILLSIIYAFTIIHYDIFSANGKCDKTWNGWKTL